MGQQFGGVAHVARCTVKTLCQDDSPLQLTRVISLLDDRDSVGSAYSGQGYKLKCCGGSRLRFTAGLMPQAAGTPTLILFDHVDIAQCQTLLPPWLRRRYAVWIHGIEVWRDLPSRKLRALREAELLVFNSHFTKQRFQSFHGHDFPAQVVHLTGGDVGECGREGTARPPWILTVGRLEPDRPKGHQQILQAMPEIVQAVPNVQWHVVGKGKALESFRASVQSSPVSDHIHLHGFLDNDQLQQLFCDCRVFAMPSFGEGFGIVYLEAMQRGCVPVGSTLDAAPEVIGDAGICLDPNDGESVERELICLLSESDDEFSRRSNLATERAELFAEANFQANLTAALSSC